MRGPWGYLGTPLGGDVKNGLGEPSFLGGPWGALGPLRRPLGDLWLPLVVLWANTGVIFRQFVRGSFANNLFDNILIAF